MNLIVSFVTASDRRCYPHPMGKRHAEHPFENDSFLDDFLEWMDSSEGQHSIEALDLVFDALEHAGVDAKQRKIVWDDGKRLSIQQSAERIHAGIRTCLSTRSKFTWAGGSKAARRILLRTSARGT